MYEESKRSIINEPIGNDFYEKKKELILKVIKSLPLYQQNILQLFYVQDYSLKEISEILNISIGTAKSRLFYAREKLKTILKE